MSEYIINNEVEVLNKSRWGPDDSCANDGKKFYIKIFTNGNIDIKYQCITDRRYEGRRTYPLNDLLIITDDIKIPIYIINIFKSLIEDVKNIRNKYGDQYDIYAPYYNSIFDIIKDFKENYKKKYDKELTEEQLEEQKEKLNKLILKNEKINKYKQNSLDRLILENERINKDKQNELDKLILENQQKINHYKNLEQEIIKVNKEKEIIKEEKRKIAICKEKMAQIKRNLDEEKFKLELEKDKINDINVDEFINSILN